MLAFSWLQQMTLSNSESVYSTAQQHLQQQNEMDHKIPDEIISLRIWELRPYLATIQSRLHRLLLAISIHLRVSWDMLLKHSNCAPRLQSPCKFNLKFRLSKWTHHLLICSIWLNGPLGWNASLDASLISPKCLFRSLWFMDQHWKWHWDNSTITHHSHLHESHQMYIFTW